MYIIIISESFIKIDSLHPRGGGGTPHVKGVGILVEILNYSPEGD